MQASYECFVQEHIIAYIKGHNLAVGHKVVKWVVIIHGDGELWGWYSLLTTQIELCEVWMG